MEKTFVVVFRPRHGSNSNVPAGARLTYRGREVSFRESFRYLGVLFSAKAGLIPAATSLAESGSKAMFALLPLLRQCHLSQLDMRCRMFDILVRCCMFDIPQIIGVGESTADCGESIPHTPYPTSGTCAFIWFACVGP